MKSGMSRKNYEPLRGPVQLCHQFLRERLKPGDRVVDATCGNGHDTLLLADLVGPSGRVWSFDIDDGALDAVENKIREASLETGIKLIHDGHERLADHVTEALRAVVFNLGYLPGGAGDIVTRPETTLAALEQSLDLLLPGGFILLAVYPGHAGGREEADAVDSWASGLPSPRFNVWRCSLLNRQAEAPYLLVIDKTAS